MAGMINKADIQPLTFHSFVRERDLFGHAWGMEVGVTSINNEITSVSYSEKHTGFAFICHIWSWLFTESQYRCENVNHMCFV